MKNLHKHKNLMGFIYAIVMLLPFCTILARTLYTQLNKNAYESYEGNLIASSTTYLSDSNNQLPTGDLVKYYCNGQTSTHDSSYSGWFTYDDISLANLNPTMIRFRYRFQQQDLQFNDGSTNYEYIPLQDFYFTLLNYNWTDTGTTYLTNFYYITYITVGTLDNAFEYSIDKTISNSNIGKLNLTNWFVDIFLDDTNATNMRYINFVNWYMNYSLLVSCVYLLYMVLMWFLTFARKLLSKGFNEEI